MRLLRSSLVPLSLTLALVSSSCSSRPGPGDVPSTYTDRPDGVLAALAGAESAQLFALHPYPFQREIAGEGELPEDRLFHSYEILGSAPSQGVDATDHLLALVEYGIEDSDGMVAACFNPRHGIRVVKDGVAHDFVICFECLSMQTYRDGGRDGGHMTSERYAHAVTRVFEAHGLTIHRDE